MARLKVQMGCRDCRMCTGHAFTGAGRSMGRGAANIATFGVAALARKNCKQCGHPMSEHQSQSAQTVVVVQAPSSGGQQPAGAAADGWWSPQADGRHRWWNGERWTDYYTGYPNDPAAVQKAFRSLDQNPPRWIVQEDGRERWWAGLTWTDDYKVEPEPVVVAITSTDTATPTAADEIKKLGELHQAGVLTDEEFAAAKKKLLGI